MTFKPYTLELTGDPEVDDRRLAEYQKKFKEWKETQRAADDAAEISDLSFSFTCGNPDAYAEAFDALRPGRMPFSEMFEALPLGDRTRSRSDFDAGPFNRFGARKARCAALAMVTRLPVRAFRVMAFSPT